MKFPKKNISLASAVICSAFLTSGMALAKPKDPPPAYFASVAGLNDADYLACIKAKLKAPAANHILENYSATLVCQKDPKS